MAYVSRVLLPIGVGRVASAQNIVTYFVLIASLGLPIYGVKVIAGLSDDREKSSVAFSELFIINAISTILCSFIYIMMILSVDFFQTKIMISVVVGIQLFANILNIDWLYQGFEEYKYITIRSAVVKIISLVAIFMFVKTQEDYIIYAFITAMGLVLNFVLNIIKLKDYVSLKLKNLEIKKHLKPVFVLLASTIAIEVYVLGGTTILSVLKGDEDVAYYTYSTKAISVVRTLIVAICAVFLPRLNYYICHSQYDDFNKLASKGISIILNLCIPIAIVLCILSDDCVNILFGANYISVIPSMQILCISLVTLALSNFTGYQILVSIGKEKIVLYSTIIGAIINLSINFALIVPFGYMGAAIAGVVTEGVIAIYQYYYVLKFVPINIGIKDILKMLIPSFAMIIPILIFKSIINDIYIEITICSLIGILIYLFAAYAVKNDFLYLILEKTKLQQRIKNNT